VIPEGANEDLKIVELVRSRPNCSIVFSCIVVIMNRTVRCLLSPIAVSHTASHTNGHAPTTARATDVQFGIEPSSQVNSKDLKNIC